VPGELWIGGSCLSDGYLGRPRLTAEKFVPHPSSEQPGARLYRSGDLVRVLATGELDFISRIDRQIKLRGFRVEIGEVEAVLGAHPRVGQAHVMLRTDDEPRLVAYVTPADETPPTDEALRAFVHDRLPSYMVPSAILVLDVLPLTANGKVDHRALPVPATSDDRFRPPVGVEQELVAAAWAEVLGVERVGLDDDFFGLGGHSLLAARLLSRVRDALGIDVPIKTLFEHPRLEAFVAAAIAHGRRDAGLEPPPPRRVERDGPLATSFSQQRLWFIDRMSPDEAAYNIPQPLRLRGDLDIPALGDALDDLVARHEALRTRIETIDGEPRQVIDPPTSRPLEVDDLRGVGDATAIEEAARRRAAEAADRPFDLTAEPLERHRLLKLAEDDHVLLFTLHHAITDGLSMEILTDELAVLYRARRAGLPAELPSLAFQFADFAAWERAWLQGEALDQQLDFWRRHLADAPPVLRLPTDHARPAMQNFVGAQVSIDCGGALGHAVRELAHRLGATPFMVLVAGWAMLLGRWAGQERVVLGTTVGHRPNTVWERVVGFFANTLALSTDLGGAPSFETLVERVRAVVLDAFAHQDLPFEKLVAELDIERDPSTPPIYQASFGLHEIGDDARRFADLDLDGFSIGTPQAKDDLHLAVGLGEDAFVATIVYNVDL
ncbi:MAG: condensation domain-containing protein, partial [Acidobacteriota bacterium]